MHHLALAGYLSAVALGHATLAAYCTLIYLRRTGEREFLVFGLLNGALTALCLGNALTAASSLDSPRLAMGLHLAEIGRIVATPLFVHHIARYVRMSVSKRVLIALYATALLFVGLDLAGFVVHVGGARAQAIEIVGLRFEDVALPPTIVGVALASLRLAAALFACFAVGRAFLSGRKEGFTFVGVTVLGVTMIHDSLRSAGLAFGPALGPHGYGVFVAMVMLTLLSRLVSLRQKLEARASDLKDRSRQLARSYDKLRAAQDEIVRKEQLAAVGELSAVIAHEVRNPLAIMANAVATLRRPGIDPNDRETLLTILDEESTRLNRLVGDLLNYARPVNLQRQFVSIEDLLRRAMGLADNKEDVVAELSIARGVHRIWADPDLVRQVVDNLVNNAVQAMQNGGTLTVTVKPRELEGATGVEVQVQDTGEGMDTQVRNRALDPFFTTRPAGTGLGLAIVARIVDAHGGKLWIKSEAGAGTIVHVFLPTSAEGAPAKLPERDRTSTLPPMPKEVRKALLGTG